MRFYERKRRMPAVIIVALIDIFAILLIFVIATSSFHRRQAAVMIRLPESTTAQPLPKSDTDPAELTISNEGEITLAGEFVESDELAGRVRAVKEAGRPLVLKADSRAPFGVVIRVLDALKEAGITGNLPAFTESK